MESEISGGRREPNMRIRWMDLVKSVKHPSAASGFLLQSASAKY